LIPVAGTIDDIKTRVIEAMHEEGEYARSTGLSFDRGKEFLFRALDAFRGSFL
jgi:hypothetical protein